MFKGGIEKIDLKWVDDAKSWPRLTVNVFGSQK